MNKMAFFRVVSILAVTALLVFAVAEEAYPNGFMGSVETTPTFAFVGDAVTVNGNGFNPNTNLDLVWQTYDVNWDLGLSDGKYNGDFLGLATSPRVEPLTSVMTDANGEFSTTFAVPEDFGGIHNLIVREDGINLNRAGLDVRAKLSVSPEEGVLGSDITVTVTGLNIGQPMAWYLLSYDHRIAGFVSALHSQGTATVVLPATGAQGPHLIRLEDSPFGHPYLALDTSPWAFLEVESQTFMLTEGDPVLPVSVTEQSLSVVAATEPMQAGPTMWVNPMAAPVGVEAILSGKGFEPGASVQLELSGMVGSRVTDSGFTPTSTEFSKVTVAEDGTFSTSFIYPDTHGGLHWISAFSDTAEEAITNAEIKIFPIAYEFETMDVVYGDTLDLHLKGIGWTQTENIFAIVVDNTYIGYACGFSTNGDVQLSLEVSWEPGWHFIDIYPSFYRNKEYSQVDEAPFMFRNALLSWEDHPSGFHFRYAFNVQPYY